MMLSINSIGPPGANTRGSRTMRSATSPTSMLGNITKMQHSTTSANGNWTRHYHYAYEDDPANRTNRLKSTSHPGDPENGPYTDIYSHDFYGNMTSTSHLADIAWSFIDQMRRVDLGGGSTAY